MFSHSAQVRAGRVFRPGFVIAFFAAIGPISSAQEGAGEKPIFSVSDPNTATALVARVGTIDITVQQFLLSYEFGPASVKREENSRRRYLEYMINEKLLALEAYARGAERAPRVLETLAEIEGDLATEELYKDDVLGKVAVTDQEVQGGVQRNRSHISLQWLFAESPVELVRLRGLLGRGIPFDSLFGGQFAGSVKRDDRVLETTRFKLAEVNPDFAHVVDTLAAGRISAPIKGPDGWYIVRIANEWRDVLVTESDDVKSHYDVRRALMKHRADSLSDSYVHTMMLGRNPVIQRGAFEIVGSSLARLTLPPDTLAAWKLDALPDSAALRKADRLTLVTTTGRPSRPPDVTHPDQAAGEFTVKNFLQWYKGRAYSIKLSKRSREAFFASVERLVWRMVRDRLLILRALERNLHTRESVRIQKRWWEEKILYEVEKGRIASSIPTDEQTLHAYFKEHQVHYRNPGGEPLPFESAVDDVRKDYHSFELTKRMLHRLIAAKKKHQVQVHEQVLLNTEIDESLQRRAIDVYLVKKGGTLPRPAFPTIDPQWQTWN